MDTTSGIQNAVFILALRGLTTTKTNYRKEVTEVNDIVKYIYPNREI